MQVVLLPGMDGTGELFGRFVAARPPGVETRVIAFSRDQPRGYAELVEFVRAGLPTGGRWLLLGESFSGPLALRVAATAPPGLAGVVLAATFVRAPGPARYVARLSNVLARARPPRRLLAWLLTRGDLALADDVGRALGSVAPDVVAARLRAIAAVDAREDLRTCQVPVLALNATRDRLVGREAAEEIASVRPGALSVEILAPHLVLQTAPAEAWAAIMGPWSAEAAAP